VNGELINRLICGDNLEELKNIPKESVDLIYIDPPFFTHRRYEVVGGDGAEAMGFKDRWEGGIEHFIGWLQPRVELMWEVLKPTGSFYLHCDWHANAYIRIMLDGIFGAKNFRNEIIWCYNVGGKSKSQWARKHDTIYFYTKSRTWRFDGKAVGFKRETGEKSFGGIIGIDKNGRRYQDKLVKATGKYYRYYLDEPKIPEDWWIDINSIQSQSAERLGYPTQKPEALLERIIKASSKEGDAILDAFCGSGTACVVAHKLKRNWTGIDISSTAIKAAERRLTVIGAVKDENYVMEPARLRCGLKDLSLSSDYHRDMGDLIL